MIISIDVEEALFLFISSFTFALWESLFFSEGLSNALKYIAFSIVKIYYPEPRSKAKINHSLSNILWSSALGE